MTDTDWMTDGACRNYNPTLFFHPDQHSRWAINDAERAAREQRAVRICLTCPVITTCATHALIKREPAGVWGGTTEADRTRIWRHDGAIRQAVIGIDEGIRHGTRRGYQQHLYRQVPPCGRCRAAETEYARKERLQAA